MLAEMWAAFSSWEPMSQLAVASLGLGSAGYAVDRYTRTAWWRRPGPVVEDEALDWDGDGVADEDEPLRHWCQGCDRLPLLMEMRWCDYGARWLCHRCAVAYPSGLAEAVVAKARTDATARLQDLLYQVAATSVSDDASLATVIPIFASVPTCTCGRSDCTGVPTHRTFDQRGQIIAAHQVPGPMIGCSCPRQVDTAGRVLRVDCDCAPDPMGFDCEHDS